MQGSAWQLCSNSQHTLTGRPPPSVGAEEVQLSQENPKERHVSPNTQDTHVQCHVF